MYDIKNSLQLENRDYDELNIMTNRVIDENVYLLFAWHTSGTKTERLVAFSALVKKFPEYKVFCYPETFLKENELKICQTNCDFVRRSAFYDLLNNYDEIRNCFNIEPDDVDTALDYVDWDGKRKIQPSKEEIDKIRETFVDIIDYADEIKRGLIYNGDEI